MTELTTEQIADIIRTFDWHNYDLDEVGEIPVENAEYANALAERILGALDGEIRPNG